jgi:broad specificity phosphatase PhoE
MQRHVPLVLLLIAAMALPAAAAPTKRRPAARTNEFGFLPGYRPPEVVERQERWLYWRRHPTYWYGWPGWYRGRWNGGGFGPCWTQTPIGNVWNCGR